MHFPDDNSIGIVDTDGDHPATIVGSLIKLDIGSISTCLTVAFPGGTGATQYI